MLPRQILKTSQFLACGKEKQKAKAAWHVIS